MVTKVTPPPPSASDLSSVRLGKSIQNQSISTPCDSAPTATFGGALRAARAKQKPNDPNSQPPTDNAPPEQVTDQSASAPPKSPAQKTAQPTNDRSSSTAGSKGKHSDKNKSTADAGDAASADHTTAADDAPAPAATDTVELTQAADDDGQKNKTETDTKSTPSGATAAKAAAVNPAVAMPPATTPPPTTPLTTNATAKTDGAAQASSGNSVITEKSGTAAIKPDAKALAAAPKATTKSQPTPATATDANPVAAASTAAPDSDVQQTDNQSPQGVAPSPQAAKGRHAGRPGAARTADGAKAKPGQDVDPTSSRQLEDGTAADASNEADTATPAKTGSDSPVPSESQPSALTAQLATASNFNTQHTAPTASTAGASAPSPAQAFADANQSQIITTITGQLLPNGGSMQITLHPASLGQIHISVQVMHGQVSATFETSTDQATRLLSHSLSQLKQTLESGGINVDKLQVQQSRDPQPQNQTQQQQQQAGNGGQRSSQQRQQRQEIIQKMWEKIANARLPIDVKA